MTDVRNWDRDANNNSLPPPDGAPEGQTAGSVNDCIRENMAANKRLDDDHNGSLSSTGTGGTYNVTSAQNGLTAYYAGQIIAYIANHANTGAVLVNVSSLGNKSLKHPNGSEMQNGDIQPGQIVMAVYRAATDDFQVLNLLGNPGVVATGAYTLDTEQVAMDFSSGTGRIRSKNTQAAPASSLALATTTSGGTTTDALGIDSAQNVSVGNAVAGWKFEVRGATGGISNSTDPQWWVQRDGGAQVLTQPTSSLGKFGTFSNHPLVVTTNNTERMRIGTGTTGIVSVKTSLVVGGTTPEPDHAGSFQHAWDARLAVSSLTATHASLRIISNKVNSASIDAGLASDNYVTVKDLALQPNGGNVGIGLEPTANMAGLSIEAGLLTLKETTTPTADANYGKIYTKADNNLYFQDGAGVERQIAFV